MLNLAEIALDFIAVQKIDREIKVAVIPEERINGNKKKELDMEENRISRYRQRLDGFLGKVNWKLVLVIGMAVSAAVLLYHTWRFMALANL